MERSTAEQQGKGAEQGPGLLTDFDSLSLSVGVKHIRLFFANSARSLRAHRRRPSRLSYGGRPGSRASRGA